MKLSTDYNIWSFEPDLVYLRPIFPLHWENPFVDEMVTKTLIVSIYCSKASFVTSVEYMSLMFMIVRLLCIHSRVLLSLTRFPVVRPQQRLSLSWDTTSLFCYIEPFVFI